MYFADPAKRGTFVELLLTGVREVTKKSDGYTAFRRECSVVTGYEESVFISSQRVGNLSKLVDENLVLVDPNAWSVHTGARWLHYLDALDVMCDARTAGSAKLSETFKKRVQAAWKHAEQLLELSIDRSIYFSQSGASGADNYTSPDDNKVLANLLAVYWSIDPESFANVNESFWTPEQINKIQLERPATKQDHQKYAAHYIVYRVDEKAGCVVKSFLEILPSTKARPVAEYENWLYVPEASPDSEKGRANGFVIPFEEHLSFVGQIENKCTKLMLLKRAGHHDRFHRGILVSLGSRDNAMAVNFVMKQTAIRSWRAAKTGFISIKQALKELGELRKFLKREKLVLKSVKPPKSL